MTDIFDPNYEENVNVTISDNKVSKGENINLTSKDPTMRKVVVGTGWKSLAFGNETLDVDISCFLINKDNLTRVDSDFIFYNNKEACDGGVVHNGDDLIGVGEGDNESISVNLEQIPFDVQKIVFTLSLYKGEEKSVNVSDIKNAYLRIVNASSSDEILRYDLTPDIADKTEAAIIVASINREGPKWHFEAIGQCVEGGLGKIATDYGIIVHQG